MVMRALPWVLAAALGVSGMGAASAEETTIKVGIARSTSNAAELMALKHGYFKEAGIKLEHVPYRGAGQAINDLIATHVKVAFLGPTALVQHYKAGVLKLLAHTGSKRSPILPEIPTLDESGYPVVLDAWYGAFVPSGTPHELVMKLNGEMNHALKDEKLRDTFLKGVVEVIGGTPEELGKLAQADSVKYARLVKELNIRIN